MTNEQARNFLLGIAALLRTVYQIEIKSDVDPRFLLTIGFVYGALTEALEAERDNRPMRIGDSREIYALRQLVTAVVALPLVPQSAALEAAINEARALIDA